MHDHHCIAIQVMPCIDTLNYRYHSYYHTESKTYRYLASQDITKVLRASALHHPRFCVNPASVECRSLRTSGAMALFSRGVDALLIKLVGRWRSDAMLRSSFSF